MKDFEIDHGATKPNLVRKLTDTPSEIDGFARIKFVMESVDGVRVERGAKMSDIQNAEVMVNWQKGDTEKRRAYIGKFHVIYKNGDIAKYPKNDKFIVEVK